MFPKLEEESDIIKRKHSITNEMGTFDEAMNIYKEYLEGNEIQKEWEDIIRYFYLENKNKLSNYNNEFSQAHLKIHELNLSLIHISEPTRH